jgi:hypothetical protein
MRSFFTRRRISRLLARLCVAAAAAIYFTSTVAAEEFRIESKVFFIKGKEESLTSESLTLFDDGKIYDFLSAPQEITLFDFSRDRIVLMDASRKVRSEFSTEKLTTFVEQLRTRAIRQSDPLLKFAVDPKFEETPLSGGAVKFVSPLITYEIKTTKVDSASVAQQYRQFSDCSARLNVMLHPGSLPPFPRLAINAALAKQEGRVPERVEVTLAPQNRLTGKPTMLRSEHSFEMRLMASDRKKIDEAGGNLVTFREVSLDDYLRPIEQAKR